MAFVTALMNSLITILLSYTSGGGWCVCVFRCVWDLSVLFSDKHIQTAIANCLGVCQESWWQQKRKIDGLLCQHSSLTLSLFSPSLCLCLYLSICSLPPALCHSTTVFFLIPPSPPPLCLPLTLSHLRFLSFCFLPSCFHVLLLSSVVYLSPGLFSADWTDRALENWVGMLHFVHVCWYVCVSVRACVSVW